MNVVEAFKMYMVACYGNDYAEKLDATQLKEVEQAFLSGMLQMLSYLRAPVSPQLFKQIETRLKAIGSLIEPTVENAKSPKQQLREGLNS